MSLRLRTEAIYDLLMRYASHTATHWRLRRQFAGPSYTATEADFLPGSLAIVERPVSPTVRTTALILVLLVFSAIAWACLSRIDIIALADGKVIPSGRTKAIASVEVAAVRAIHVVEGQSVRKGQVLIELDAGIFEADERRAEVDATTARLEQTRSKALIEAIDEHHPPVFPRMQGVDSSLYAQALAQVRGQYGDYQAKLAELDAQIARYAAALPLAAERAKDYAVLSQTQDVSATASSEKQQAVIDLAGQLNQARSSRESLITETRKQALETMNQASRANAMAVQDAARASSHEHQMILRAPVDGVVQQLNAHTVGGVVPAAETLMNIVPVNDSVEVEAYVENKDIGFVREGQDAQIKIDAFDYTRHGSLHGRVSHVSTDAVADEKHGWVYRLRIVLDHDSMLIDGHPRRLMPGMTVKVEIKTGRRRVIEYLLSPLSRRGDESFHER